MKTPKGTKRKDIPKTEICACPCRGEIVRRNPDGTPVFRSPGAATKHYFPKDYAKGKIYA